MTPVFAKAVEPVMLRVLELIDRIEKDERAVSPQDERIAIVTQLDYASGILGAGEEWQLAMYAIVSWIDEMLLEIPWAGRDWWSNNVLEVEVFGTRLCFQQFFIRAQQASKLPRRDALEVFYNCVVLGFRGLYSDPQLAASWAPQHGLPSELPTWLKQTGLMIRLGQGLPELADGSIEINGAPPLRNKTRFMWACVLLLILLMCNFVVFST